MITSILTSNDKKESSSNRHDSKTTRKRGGGYDHDTTMALCCNSDPDDSYKTLIWWGILSLIATFNISLWFRTYLTIGRDDDGIMQISPYQKQQLFLSGIYVFVCAYRSILPRIDLERYCLFDTILSSIFLGRLAATIAEISFSAQLALFLYKLGENHDHPIAQTFAVLIVPAVTVAQAFCWCGVLTLNHLYHAIEESIWAILGGALGCSFLSFALYHSNNERLVRLGFFGSIASVMFFAFMIMVDVPMYLTRWKQGQKHGEEAKRLLVRKGSSDAWRRRVVTTSWKIW
eukprot:CAMPEP_0176489412 /NCGR_PEP_ID=MMETSP0200_2-20121128/7273_1 /TAXON_ID=947934 /ORGANISM="Chaetoceros sp., Strain GSL56" /LENGTH=288 /DNA_ID=CAMNT_0017886549 /DNA_START=2508 /DNA_END=3371 /DNA_ORIENTATION=-